MNTAQTTKNLAKTIAKQIAQEPLEILKEAGKQLTGNEQNRPSQQPQNEIPENPEEKYQRELNDKLKSGRRIEAFDRELKDIAKENLFRQLQAKISEGKEVYVDEYQELSMEQKQVLKAQQEAFQKQNEIQQNQGKDSFLQIISKKGRRMVGGGQKREAEKQTTRVEKPIPPSG